MLDMANKKKDRHVHPQLTMRLPPEYRAALQAAAKKNRRSMTEEAKIAFEKYLESQGVWPPEVDEEA